MAEIKIVNWVESPVSDLGLGDWIVHNGRVVEVQDCQIAGREVELTYRDYSKSTYTENTVVIPRMQSRGGYTRIQTLSFKLS
ncbi:hypothetical protein SEA_REINDEER_150 [Mycobacterium phage Reindeer]|uniref:Uncharacterized protein n=1 Tax=Mycobacterium phage Reindeer TaxID=2762283 RepID=A0A7G8LI69_9CAUD|nr:hypothetical protein J4U05_gp102 [Mycobacterium phage Reindeer]QNJ56941.1 hypothetical protein SEA_REINDEER_150 [Mycobacterium phage Reindeer]